MMGEDTSVEFLVRKPKCRELTILVLYWVRSIKLNMSYCGRYALKETKCNH